MPLTARTRSVAFNLDQPRCQYSHPFSCSSVPSLRSSCPSKNPFPDPPRLRRGPWILRQSHLDVRQEVESRRQSHLLPLSADDDRKLSSLRSVRVFRAELLRPRRISRADSTDGEKEITHLNACRIRRA